MQLLFAIAVVVAPLVFHAASETSQRTTKLLLYQRDVELVDDVTSPERQVRSTLECAAVCAENQPDCKAMSVCTNQAGT